MAYALFDWATKKPPETGGLIRINLEWFYLNLVPRKGLEPPRCYSLVPETSASTNSATWAYMLHKCNVF